MLKYLISSVEQLLALMIMTGLLSAYLEHAFGPKGKLGTRTGICAGLIAGFVMGYFKNYTNRIDTGRWNLRNFSVMLAAFLVFLVMTALAKKVKWAGTAAVAAGAVMIALLFLYYLPDFLSYPHIVLQTEKTVFSTAFLYRMIGAVLGLVLCIVAGVSVFQGALRLSLSVSFLLAVLALAVNEVREITSSFSIMLAKRLIPSNHTLFVIAKHASNYSQWFIFLTIAVGAVVPVILWVRSFHVNEPYRNSAERRKIIAKWRSARRWSTSCLICGVLSVLMLTSVKEYANREVELSPIEDAPVKDGAVYVSFDQVSDGHLHRFGYTTEDGVTIRFIVIQKPNSSAYGVGLDACDICGETGYYEKGGQVVCNLCDVVMNINTIGFKGGCNPKVIDYEIHDGNIIVPVDGLMEYESDFK